MERTEMTKNDLGRRTTYSQKADCRQAVETNSFCDAVGQA